MKTMSLLLSTLALAASVAIANAVPSTGLHYGDALPLRAGTARAWVAVDVDGTPVSMGVSIDEKAMRSGRKGVAEARLPLPASIQVRPEVIVNARDAAKAAVSAFIVRYDRETRSYVVVYDGFVSPAQLVATR